MNFREYAQKWNRDPNNNFAVACYNQNSIDELLNSYRADETDCQTWGISADEWNDAIETALTEKLNETA